MTKFEFNGKEYLVPESWDELTLGDYCRVFQGMPSELESGDTENELEHFRRLREMESVILSRLLGEKDDFCMSMPLNAYAYLNESVKWMYDIKPFMDAPTGYLKICGNEWTIPPLQEMPLRSYINADMTMQGDNVAYPELLRCILARKDGDKSSEGRIEPHGEWIPFEGDVGIIEKIPCSKALGFVYHFFLLGSASQKISKAFSRIQEATQ